MSGICVKMDGKKCAMEYCDFWNHEEQICSLALESRKRIEVLNIALRKAEKILMDAKEEEDLMTIIKDLNIITVSKAMQ